MRLVQDITSNHINFSGHCTTCSPTSDHLYQQMLSHGPVNFTHVDYDYNKCRGRAETAEEYQSCEYLNEEDVELTSKDNYEVIKKENKEVSTNKEPQSTILEKPFQKYKASSTNSNLTDGYYSLWIVLYQTTLVFCFTTSSTVTIRYELLDYLIRQLEGTEKPILTANSYKPLSKKILAAVVRKAIQNVQSQFDAIHTNVQQHYRQCQTECNDQNFQSRGNSQQMSSRYIGLEDTMCSLCVNKVHEYLPYCQIRPVLQKEKQFQGNQQESQNQVATSTTPLPDVETMSKWEISHARIAPNIL